MAKRRKLSDEETEAALGRIVHVEELLTLPEAEKLRRLDDEMGRIFNKKKLRMDEKVRLFEETLANFRQVQEKIAKMGGVSMIREEEAEEQQNVTELIRTLVEEALDEREKKKKKGRDGESSMEDSSVERSASMENTVPDDMMVSAIDDFSMGTPRKDGSFETSTPEHPKRRTDISTKLSMSSRKQGEAKSEDDISTKLSTSSRKQGEAKSEILKLLVEKGVVVKDQNLFFKTGSKKPVSYKKSFFDRVLNHLTLKDAAPPPHNSHRLIELIDATLKEAEPKRYAGLLSSNPNLKRAVGADDMFDKWEHVK